MGVLEGLIGKGSFGCTYRAKWMFTPVAVKVVTYKEAVDDAVLESEGDLAMQLAHPNLVQTFIYSARGINACTTPPRYEVWIVQELCDMGTLHDRIFKRPPMEEGGFSEVVEIAGEIAAAGAYLHGRDIIHGDLTPSNVLLSVSSCQKGYTVKVGDFGLSRVLEKERSGIDTQTMGSVRYMPPERFEVEGSRLTKRVDFYAFGVIFWQLITGEMPYSGLSSTQVVVNVCRGLTLQLPDGVPPFLANIFLQATATQKDAFPGFDNIVCTLVSIADARDWCMGGLLCGVSIGGEVASPAE